MAVPKRNVQSKPKERFDWIEKRRSSYLKKDIEEYNAQDFVFYFSQVYEIVKGVPYFTKMAEDSAKMKRLMGGLDNFSLVKLIDYVIANKEDIGIGLLSSSWVNQFIKEAGIKYPELSKYEILKTSVFLTKKERELVGKWFDGLLACKEDLDEKAIYDIEIFEGRFDSIKLEIKRRKELLTNSIEVVE